LQEISIVTDSTADLPKNLIRDYGVTVVPLKVIFSNGEVFRDGVDIKTEEFYFRQVNKRESSTTSQPSPAEFIEVYKELLTRSKCIISIHISSEMSGTAHSARTAARTLAGADINVIDSRLVSMALGIIVLEAARAVREGRKKAEVLSLIENMIKESKVFFVVDTLEYLARGGRIGKARSFLGTLLNIRPVCCLKEGAVFPCEKVRGKTRSIERLVQIVRENTGEKPLLCSLVHGMDPDGVKKLHRLVIEKLNLVNEPIISGLGAVVGSHVGPGVLGIVYYPCLERGGNKVEQIFSR
jgi:DegV family protein with EDD domain